MEFDYKIKAEGYEGSVRIAAPSYPQRLKYLKELNLKTQDGQVVSSLADNVDALLKMLDLAEKHVVHVAIVHKESAKAYKTWPELLEDADDVCNEVAQLAVMGPKLGKL